MKALTLIATLMLTSAAFASQTKVELDCKSPAGFAGNSANVTGTLILSKHPTYATPAKQVDGTLTVKIGGSTKDLVLNKKLKVLGQYDNVSGIEYAHVGSLPDGNVTIYINLTDKDTSYVEYKGQQYLMNCAE